MIPTSDPTDPTDPSDSSDSSDSSDPSDPTDPTGGFGEHRKFLSLVYTAKDVRYTSTKDGKTVYAILLGVPEAGSKILLESFAGSGKKVGRVNLLSGGAVEFQQGAKGLTLTVPAGVKNCKDATTFKIMLK